MTKKQAVTEKRVKPIGVEGINACRKIVADKQYAKVNEVMIDIYTASAIVAVYDKVNGANQQKLAACPVGKCALLCLGMVQS